MGEAYPITSADIANHNAREAILKNSELEQRIEKLEEQITKLSKSLADLYRYVNHSWEL